ncbi:hypothetical protein ACFW6E_08825 [Streptomyces olivaceoviridis]|uniref:hypothetical protein n=1 Tax=Streptomyces olivaceoviridis TaxID=1921 RepID=UPI00368F7B5B
MTDQQLDLDAIQTRANAATPGPWCTDSWEIYQGTEYEPGLSMWIGETCRGTSSLEQDRADAAFVAAARTDVPALVAEVHRLRARVAELEEAGTYARSALAALCYDLEDPGSNALGALYEISRATTGVEAPRDDAALALAKHASEVLEHTADIADPEPPEASFFGDYGPQVADWLRRRATDARRTPAVLPSSGA